MTTDLKPTVLVVDDHRFSRTVLSRILNAAGYRVEVVETAEAALEQAVSREPDAFVLDAEMPGMSGIELCWRLRALPRFRMTPILIATANEDRYLLRSAFTAGCDDFLVKPLEPLVVVARLGGLIKKADYYKQLERVRGELSRYVSPRIRKLIEHRSLLDTETAARPTLAEVCVLFSDIRGFTALSHAIEPTTLFRSVSEHLGAQVECVYRHNGYVDKFGGDGVMAVFDGRHMAADACRCALAIMERVTELAAPTVDQPVPVGVGIHAGSVVVGSIGSGDHLDYTVVGETVNVAARLCGYAQPMNIVVSDAVRGQVAEDEPLAFGDGRSVTVRGLSEPVVLYHLARVEHVGASGGS